MHGTAKRPHLSAVTTGARLFAERMDLRTPRGRRFKDLIASYTKAVGSPSEAQRALIREVAMMQVIGEDLQGTFLDTGKLDHTQHSRVVNLMKRHMKTLGLFSTGKSASDDDEDETDPLEYVKRGRKRSTIDDEDEE